MASPKKRERLESGEPRQPWKENPELSSGPPFEEGNMASVRHGAVSHRMLAPVAARLEEQIRVLAPWCARPAFQAAVKAWAWAEATCELYRAHFKDRGVFDRDGGPLPGLVRWDRAEARAAALRKRLALDPAALGSLLSKLSAVESSGGTQAQREMQALRQEISDLDEAIAEAMEPKELERGE